jgi:hypothetical protein
MDRCHTVTCILLSLFIDRSNVQNDVIAKKLDSGQHISITNHEMIDFFFEDCRSGPQSMVINDREACCILQLKIYCCRTASLSQVPLECPISDALKQPTGRIEHRVCQWDAPLVAKDRRDISTGHYKHTKTFTMLTVLWVQIQGCSGRSLGFEGIYDIRYSSDVIVFFTNSIIIIFTLSWVSS